MNIFICFAGDIMWYKFCGLMISSLIVGIVTGGYSAAIGTIDAPFPYGSTTTTPTASDGSIKGEIKASVMDKQGPIQQLTRLFLPNRPAGEGVMGYIKYIVDIALSLVTFIAVLVLIYGFYGILFRESQEGITNAKKVVKGTLIAIVLIGSSWIIVKFLFYIVTLL